MRCVYFSHYTAGNGDSGTSRPENVQGEKHNGKMGAKVAKFYLKHGVDRFTTYILTDL
jgi:hypothetical protein